MSAQTAFDFTVAFVPATRLRRRRRARPAEPTEQVEAERPRIRGDCENGKGIRPCPFVSCRHNLALDITADGSIRMSAGPRRGKTLRQAQGWGVSDWIERAADVVLEMTETCSLDVAEQGGLTLEEVGAVTGDSWQRVREIEESGLRRLRLTKSVRLRPLLQDEGAES